MKTCIIPQRLLWSAAGLAAMLGVGAIGVHAGQDAKKKPSLAVHVSPALGFVGGRIVATAELTGGADDYEDYYCAKADWDWGDSQTTTSDDNDCDPYQPGKSHILRHFAQEHKYTDSGMYTIIFTLRQGQRAVVNGQTRVEIRGEAPHVASAGTSR